MNKTNSKIFIIDDDKFLLDMYTVKFKERGMEVKTALGGEEALRMLREGLAPDAILLDIVMPGVDGFELLDTIKKESLGGNSAIIVLSNQGQEPEIERARQFGVDDYIVKASAIPSEVLDKVVAILDKKQGT